MLRIIFIIIAMLVFIGLILLQVYLSKRNNKWLGLILPFIFLIIALFASITTPLYVVTEEATVSYSENGQVVEETISPASSEKPSLATIIATIIPLFLLWNIPTLIFLGIYGVCRDQMKKNGELNRMNVLDL